MSTEDKEESNKSKEDLDSNGEHSLSTNYNIKSIWNYRKWGYWVRKIKNFIQSMHMHIHA